MTDKKKNILQNFLNWYMSNYKVTQYIYLMEDEYFQLINSKNIAVSCKIYSEYLKFINKFIINKKVLMVLK